MLSLIFEPEDDPLFQNEYENALFATSGKPHWEGYEKGKKIAQPTSSAQRRRQEIIRPRDYLRHETS